MVSVQETAGRTFFFLNDAFLSNQMNNQVCNEKYQLEPTVPTQPVENYYFSYRGATVVQEVKKSFGNQKVASSIPCRIVLEQDTEPLIAPDVQMQKFLVSRFG